VRGKHTGDSLGFAATQAPVEITGIAIVRVADGKIVEAWNNFDFLTMHRQLGTI
jgi:predicted ester cyclase